MGFDIVWGEERAYHALEITDEETIQDFTSLVTVSDVLKGLRGVLATYIEEDFFTTTMLYY
jgi:hypothetical protein